MYLINDTQTIIEHWDKKHIQPTAKDTAPHLRAERSTETAPQDGQPGVGQAPGRPPSGAVTVQEVGDNHNPIGVGSVRVTPSRRWRHLTDGATRQIAPTSEQAPASAAITPARPQWTRPRPPPQHPRPPRSDGPGRERPPDETYMPHQRGAATATSLQRAPPAPPETIGHLQSEMSGR